MRNVYQSRRVFFFVMFNATSALQLETTTNGVETSLAQDDGITKVHLLSSTKEFARGFLSTHPWSMTDTKNETKLKTIWEDQPRKEKECETKTFCPN